MIRLMLLANKTTMRLFFLTDTILKKLVRLITIPKISQMITHKHRSLPLSPTGPTQSCILLPSSSCSSSRTKRKIRRRRTWSTRMISIPWCAISSLTLVFLTEDIRRSRTLLCSSTSRLLMLAISWCEKSNK